MCDPWSVHIATPDFAPLRWRQDAAATTTADGDSHGDVDDDDVSTIAPRLVQTFLYWRDDPDDNQYAKPIDVLPVVDLNAGVVVDTSFQPGAPPKISEVWPKPTVPRTSCTYRLIPFNHALKGPGHSVTQYP